MNALDLVKIVPLMELTSGSSDVKIGLIDGPVATEHPDLMSERLRNVAGNDGALCTRANRAACLHGTFVAGILCGRRTSPAPSICANCTLLIRPIFGKTTTWREHLPSATPGELASAIIECIDAGAQVLNLSLAIARPSIGEEQALEDALNQAAKRGVIVVAAAGNQGTLGSSAITRHPWVIPVVACDLAGRPMNESNLGGSIGRRGLRAPGDGVTSLGAEGQPLTFGGTSVAAPFVTGAIALLWSEFPAASPAQIKLAITQAGAPRRASVVPPLLDAMAAYRTLSMTKGQRRTP
jgi:subtilisin family serine protease